MLRSAYKFYWSVRDLLISWGIVDRPGFHLQRHAVGTVRERMQKRGTRRRLRRTSLQRLIG